MYFDRILMYSFLLLIWQVYTMNLKELLYHHLSVNLILQNLLQLLWRIVSSMMRTYRHMQQFILAKLNNHPCPALRLIQISRLNLIPLSVHPQMNKMWNVIIQNLLNLLLKPIVEVEKQHMSIYCFMKIASLSCLFLCWSKKRKPLRNIFSVLLLTKLINCVTLLVQKEALNSIVLQIYKCNFLC